jgi:hypothetical protein
LIIRIVGRWFTRVIRDDILDLFLLSKAGYSVFYDNENRLFDRFVRVFVLRLPSGEVQRRQKLGERSLAGYAGHRRFFDYPNGKRITY